MRVISFLRSDSQYKYVISAREGSSVAVLFKRRKFGQPQAEGGEVVGWSKAEEVQAFREASDWLTQFLHRDGSPRTGDHVFSHLDVHPEIAPHRDNPWIEERRSATPLVDVALEDLEKP